VRETDGAGVAGTVDGLRIVVGGGRYVLGQGAQGDLATLRRDLPPGAASVVVAVDGALAGLILLEDELRPDAPALLDALRAAGIDRIVLASGDRREVVETVAATLGLSEAFGELSPADKVAVVARESAAAPTMMVGDGINDAPALASATVGIAMGARGAAASSESADVVLLVDRLDSLAGAVRIAHRTRRIALQSVLIGLGLSVAAMIVAAFGYLPPVAGALTQEAIDVAVILNALRALGGGRQDRDISQTSSKASSAGTAKTTSRIGSSSRTV
jgi:cation transport ATPase